MGNFQQQAFSAGRVLIVSRPVSAARCKTARINVGASNAPDRERAVTSRKTAVAVQSEIIVMHVGQKMDDGSIYAGISPDTGKTMFAAQADVSLSVTFNQAQDCAAAMIAHGRRDWRVPSRGELKVMFDNLAAIGGFDRGKWYRSATQETNFSAWCQNFGDGRQKQMGDEMPFALRCVRG
jgi:hypothetical protein